MIALHIAIFIEAFDFFFFSVPASVFFVLSVAPPGHLINKSRYSVRGASPVTRHSSRAKDALNLTPLPPFL